MLEKEFKSLISRKKYDQLSMEFQWDPVLIQTNFYYLDTNNTLKKRGINVRVRKSPDKILLQVKTPMSGEGALHVSHESEVELSEVPYIIKREQLEEYLSFSVGDLYMIGQLKTYRKDFQWDDKHLISLDKSCYLDQTDYEIEIEYEEDKISNKLEVQLHALGVDFDKNTSGKRSRFFKTLIDIIT